MKKWIETTGCKNHTHCVACRTDVNWRASLLHAGLVKERDFDCPHGITEESAAAIQDAAMSKLSENKSNTARKNKHDNEESGREAWRWLHEESKKGTLTVDSLEKEFEPRIPAYGCACRKEWKNILLTIPFRLNDQRQWAVDVHNAVNIKLGKPTWVFDS